MTNEDKSKEQKAKDAVGNKSRKLTEEETAKVAGGFLKPKLPGLR